MAPTRTFDCYLVEKQANGTFTGSVQQRTLADLPGEGVLLQVESSSLNYKDALSATGHPGVSRNFPHVPGIDAAGIVLESDDPRYRPGDAVIATGHDLGTERWGGWSGCMRVPADWLVPLPSGLTATDAMTLGTAGFTAAQCVQALQKHRVTPDQGEVLVTGATGGVGSLSVMILSQLGYRVCAVTGKAEHHGWLKSLGADSVETRDLLAENSRPLLSARFAGAVDTVGGSPLASLLKMIAHRGCVACCGLTAGSELSTTVYPFILRGITLSGIDSAWCPDAERAEIWQKLASAWKPQALDSIRQDIRLDEVDQQIARILKGDVAGRVVLDLTGNTNLS